MLLMTGSPAYTQASAKPFETTCDRPGTALRAETAHQLSLQLMVLSCQPSHVAGNLQQSPQEKFMLANRALQKGQSIPSPQAALVLRTPPPPKRQSHWACRSISTRKRKVYLLSSVKAPIALSFSLPLFQKCSCPYILKETTILFFFLVVAVVRETEMWKLCKMSLFFLGLLVTFQKVHFHNFYSTPTLHHSLTLKNTNKKQCTISDGDIYYSLLFDLADLTTKELFRSLFFVVWLRLHFLTIAYAGF